MSLRRIFRLKENPMEVETEQTMLADRSKNLCRVCLTASKNNQCIFRTDRNDPENAETYDLLEKLRLCGGVEIMENDGLPAGICTKCIAKLNDAHELRIQCQRADARLRELFGKAVRNYDDIHASASTKDQCCQTNYFCTSRTVGVENTTWPELFDCKPLITSNSLKIEQSDSIVDNVPLQEQFYEECDKADQHSNKQNMCIKHKQSAYEKVTTGREAYRTRRSTMFKRVTSMESLKNHKERQRKYIKKNVNVKRDSLENDCTMNVKNTHNGIDSNSASDLMYVCSKCDRCYSSKRSLDRHALTHDERKYTCEKCGKEFFQLEKLLHHSKLHKTKEKPKPVQCKICSKTFRKTDTMVRHLNAHKKANPKEVLSILKEIRDRRKLENPAAYHERLDKFATNGDEIVVKKEKLAEQENLPTICASESSADTCSKDIESSIDPLPNADCKIANKIETFDDVSLYRCEHCSKRYATEKSLQRHLLIHDEKKFVCNVCNMKFFRQDRLKSHKDRYGHDKDKAPLETQKPPDEKSAIKLINSWIREELDSDNEEKGFPCKICGKSYDTKKSLLKHQVNVHDTKDEGCTNCGKECVCGDEGKAQEKSSEKSKPYTCDECNKSFEKEVKLQRHMRIHERAKEQQDSNFKRFLCHICSKTFRQNTGLMFHMRTHTGYKPHVCKYCGRGFTSNSNCINHERTHTGDRPFVCHFCSAAFAKSCTLKAHITTHTGEANYHCKTCGKSFRRLKYLKEHRFTHTGEKPYACKICGTAYSHSGSLFVHEKKCKAQYNNYQPNTTEPNAQGYCQPQTSSPAVAPIITTLPQNHLNSISGSLNAQTGKSYIDAIQRMNTQGVAPASGIVASDLHVHPSAEISDVSSAVRNFALIGQIFQS